MQRDLHHSILAKRAIAPTTVGTTGTGHTSPTIDRLGYQGVEFIASFGSVTATNATVAMKLLECDTTGGSFTTVAAADLLGTLAAFGIGATASRVSGVSKNVAKQIGYIGRKRYLQVSEVPTVSAGVNVDVVALLHSPSHAPAGATEV